MSLPLASTISASDTTLTVFGAIENSSGPGVITIESEQIAYTGNSPNQFFGLTRGYNGTTAATHAQNTALTFVADAVPDVSGSFLVNGTMVCRKDNATSFRVKGPQDPSEGDSDVQSYAGIFYNDGYDTLGTLKTRASFGANLEMDLAFQSPHALMLIAQDGSQTDGVITALTQTNMVINARGDAETLSPKRLVIDRVDTGTTGTSNTSDVNVTVNSGNLRLMSGNVLGAVVLPTLTTTERDAVTSPVVGSIIYNTSTNKLNIYDGAWKEVTSA